jgi:hypothetical protein
MTKFDMNKITLIKEFESQDELLEHLQYIDKARLGSKVEKGLMKELEWFFDENPKPKAKEIKSFIKEFIQTYL